MVRRFLAFLIHAVAAIVLSTAYAAPPPGDIQARPVLPWVHTRWLVKDGVPPNINGIAQTSDGWLWLASSTGLFRFDGVSFERFRPPAGADLPGAIERIGVLPDGTLWIAPRFGDLYLLRGDQLRTFTVRDGLPRGFVEDVAQDAQGRLWIASGLGLYRLDPGSRAWREAGNGIGLPDGGIASLLVDRRGALWLLGSAGVYTLPSNARRATRVAAQEGGGALRQAPDGAIWASDMSAHRIRRVTPGLGDPRTERLLSSVELMRFTIDRHGNIWLPEYGGLGKVDVQREVPELQGFTFQHGLSGHHADTTFEDREGNLWVSTSSGLDQFRASRLLELPLPPYASEARPLAAGDGGEFWVDHLYYRTADAAPEPFAPASTEQTMIRALYRDPQGVLWSGAQDGLWRVEGRTRRRVPFPAPLQQARLRTIFALAMDAEGGLWMSNGRRGTWRLQDGVWNAHGGIAALAGLGTTTIVPGPDRTLWFGSTASTFVVLRDGTAKRFGPSDGVDVGSVLQIAPAGKGAYLGGENGLAYFDGARARPIRGEDGERFPGTTGMVVTPEGDLWVHTGRGLFGIAAQELARARERADYRPGYRRFDENDGLKGVAAPMLPLPSLVRTSSGQLLVSTGSGVFRFDPARAIQNKVVPPVHVTAIAADNTAYTPGAGLTLKSAPDTVRVAYTALSLAQPQRVRFRYRLDGVDHQWQEAGARRAAFYTQLAPGHYTFRVMAANEDGLWNERGAAVAFEIPPTLTQTTWFRVLCAAALAVVAWALHRLRLKAALKRQSSLLNARAAERERIARDLHDTLLQSVQGLILAFKRIAQRTPADAPTRPLMDRALALATDVIVEGRNKVAGLRDERSSPALAATLRQHGETLAEQHPPAFDLRIDGKARPLRSAVQEELAAIGCEAVQNAFVHAQATRVAVVLCFGDREFALQVRDDGRGIDDAVRGGTPGHWGIPGMVERAAEVGAVLELTSAPGHGSTWTVRLPARLAYEPGTPQAPRPSGQSARHAAAPLDTSAIARTDAGI